MESRNLEDLSLDDLIYYKHLFASLVGVLLLLSVVLFIEVTESTGWECSILAGITAVLAQMSFNLFRQLMEIVHEIKGRINQQ